MHSPTFRKRTFFVPWGGGEGITSWGQAPEAQALTAPAQPFLELPQWGPEGFWTRFFRDSTDNRSRTS